jgi:hypothetical protein
MWAIVAAGIGFMGGGVMAWTIGTLVGWWRRPRISVTFDERSGCYIHTLQAGGSSPPFDARFLRLLVRNSGRSVIRGCSGYVILIETRDANSASIYGKEVLELKWAHQDVGAKDIPVGAFFYLDLVKLLLPTQGPGLFPCSNVIPNSYVAPPSRTPIFGQGLSTAKYRFETLIAAENAAPVRFDVVFAFDPAKTELEVSYAAAPFWKR